MIRRLAFFGCGALFAAGLAISGMSDPGKVLGFLDVTGRWDPSLALVMLGAVASFGGLRRLVLRRPAPLWGESFPRETPERIDARLLAGAATFGLGWGLVGLCPGPAITDLATLHPPVLVFVTAMIAGMLLARRAFGADG